MDRTGYLGASDAGAILGVDPWRTPLRVYQETIGEVESDDAPSLQAEVGTALEPLLLRKWSRRRGIEIEDWPVGQVTHPELPFIRARPDGLAVDGSCVIEAKSTDEWDAWGPDGSNQVPLYYMAQGVVLMACTGRDVVEYPVLLGKREFRVLRVEREGELEAMVIGRMADFWRGHVEPRTPPDPQTDKEVAIRWRHAVAGKTVPMTPEFEEILADYHRTTLTLRDLTKHKDHLRSQILRRVEDASAVVDEDGTMLVSLPSVTRKEYVVHESTMRRITLSKGLKTLLEKRSWTVSRLAELEVNDD